MIGHQGVRLGPEILNDHLLNMAVSFLDIADRDQRLHPLCPRFADADQQHRSERNLGTPRSQIGSASCRERVCQYVSNSVVAVSLQKTSKKTHRYIIQYLI